MVYWPCIQGSYQDSPQLREMGLPRLRSYPYQKWMARIDKDMPGAVSMTQRGPNYREWLYPQKFGGTLERGKSIFVFTLLMLQLFLQIDHLKGQPRGNRKVFLSEIQKLMEQLRGNAHKPAANNKKK